MFDLNIMTLRDHYTSLHYACLAPSLNMINDLLRDRRTNAFALDGKLRTPKFYVPQQYLTSKKLISKFEKNHLFRYFRDPDAFNRSVTNNQMVENENFVSGVISQGAKYFSGSQGPGLMPAGPMKLLQDFRTDTEDLLSVRMSRQVPGSLSVCKKLKLRSSAGLGSSVDESTGAENVSEDVRIGLLPYSKVRHGSRSRRKRNLAKVAGRGMSPIIRRNSGMGVNASQKVREQVIEILNKRMEVVIDKQVLLFQEVSQSLKKRKSVEQELIQKLRKLWQSYAKLVKMISLYKDVLGISINFGEGSKISKKLKTSLKVISNLLELLAVDRDRSSYFCFFWRATAACYLNYTSKLKKILSLVKVVEKNRKLRKKTISLFYEREVRNLSEEVAYRPSIGI